MEMKCSTCNKFYPSSELDCPHCRGAVDVSAKLEKPKPAAASPASRSYGTPGQMKLDCSTCKSEKTMAATQIAKFPPFIRFIGYVIALPSALGMLFAVILFVTTGEATTEVMTTAQSEAAEAGAMIGAGIGFGFALFVGFSSLVGGLIGWLLLMKKKVFKCVNCGFILDRG